MYAQKRKCQKSLGASIYMLMHHYAVAYAWYMHSFKSVILCAGHFFRSKDVKLIESYNKFWNKNEKFINLSCLKGRTKDFCEFPTVIIYYKLTVILRSTYPQ